MAHRADLTAHRGAVLHFRSDPGEHDAPDAYEYREDGLLLVRDGKIEKVGELDRVICCPTRRTAR